MKMSCVGFPSSVVKSIRYIEVNIDILLLIIV